MTSPADIFLWGALPYIAVALLVSGAVWRYRYDRFGWTTRSSELYESRLLRIGSPMFHVGLLFVLAGHVIGLFVPEGWTDAIGLDETAYHALALSLGLAAGGLTLAGAALLVWRRRTTGPVFLATTRNDKMMYVFLLAALVLGLGTTLLNTSSSGYDYRTTVSPWVRSLFRLNPEVALMAGTPVEYRVHAVAGLLLFALVPYTRLVHALTAPLPYLFRPYIVYRSRDPRVLATSRARRGWERTGS